MPTRFAAKTSILAAIVFATAVTAIFAQTDEEERFDAFVIRGSAVALHLARQDVTRGRMWTYLTDIPQSPLDVDPTTRWPRAESTRPVIPPMRSYFELP